MAGISVVIATYNRAPLLGATIEQLRKQEYLPGDEVIIVDNGSTDATADVLALASREFPVPLRVLHEKARGKGPALALGLAAATGDVLALTDDDVLVADDWVARIRAIFSDPEIALVGGRVDPNWEAAPPSWLSLQDDNRYGAMGSPLALQHYGDAQDLGSRTAVGANLVIRRNVLLTLGGVRTNLARKAGSLFGVEDQDLCRRAQFAGHKCVYSPDLRVRHWVPKERLQLAYYSRWFFWSGYGNALLGTDDPVRSDGQPRPVTAYFFLHTIAASLSAVGHLLRRRTTNAAEMAMDAFYSAGYVVQRVRSRMLRYTRGGTACLLALAALFAPTANLPSDRSAPVHGSIRSWRCRRIPDDVSFARIGDCAKPTFTEARTEACGVRFRHVRSYMDVVFPNLVKALPSLGRARHTALRHSNVTGRQGAEPLSKPEVQADSHV